MPRKKKRLQRKFNFDEWLRLDYKHWRAILLSTPKLTEVFFKRMLVLHELNVRELLLKTMPQHITENDFEKMEEWILTHPLTGEQRGAVLVLAHGLVLRELCKTRGRLDPTKTQIAVQAIQFCWSSLIDDDWKYIYFDAKRGAEFRHALRANSYKAVTARQNKAQQRRKLCRDLAKEDSHSGTRSIRKSASHIGDLIRRRGLLLGEVPKHSTIRADIRDMFPHRVIKK
jgi:hypothetical protein